MVRSAFTQADLELLADEDFQRSVSADSPELAHRCLVERGQAGGEQLWSNTLGGANRGTAEALEKFANDPSTPLDKAEAARALAHTLRTQSD